MLQIGEYVLLKEGEESPLGKLNLAEHRLLKRKAALKRLSFPVNQGSLQDLEGKIASLAAIEHPNLARLQNVGFKENSCYFAYDWMSSSSEPCLNLRKYSQDKQLSEEEVYLIALQIASALDKIHSLSMIHLGVKASNVLIDFSKGSPVAYLTDMGLSALFPPQVFILGLLEKCTRNLDSSDKFSSFWESFHALAPEQKEGSSSFKSDVYAFGVMLYKVLMGQFPQGRFPLPSESAKAFRYNWDLFFSLCLNPNPAIRPSELVLSLRNIAGGAAQFQIKVEGVKQNSESSFKPQLNPGEIHRPQFDADPGSVFQVESAIVRYQPEAQEMKSTDPIETKMVIIQGGSFSRGSNQGARDESPRHIIELTPFAMDTHPVTNEQFVRFLEAMGGEKDGNNNDMIRLRDSRIKRSGGKVSIESGYSKHPVVGVSWYGASAYAKWVGKRLPSEVEWEVAAYGTENDAQYPTGNTIERSQANFFSSDTTAVASYLPNTYGLYDMAGNVYEWCNDWYDYHYYDVSLQEPINPKGPQQGVYRILRGGCWKSLKEDLRCAHRHRNNPGTMTGTYGFRCVADVAFG